MLTRQPEFDHFVETIVDGPIELFRLIARDDEHKSARKQKMKQGRKERNVPIRLLASAIEKSVQSSAHILADVLGASLAQKGVRFVDE